MRKVNKTAYCERVLHHFNGSIIRFKLTEEQTDF